MKGFTSVDSTADQCQTFCLALQWEKDSCSKYFMSAATDISCLVHNGLKYSIFFWKK